LKIVSLHIENFKGITNIDISDLPNLVVIVGENGIGKTSIFEAVSFLKSFAGPYVSQDTQLWQAKMQQQNPIRAGENQMRIMMEIQPTTDAERITTNQKNSKATIHVTFDGTRFTQNLTDENNASVLLRMWKSNQNLGAIEIIPANRTFREGQLQLQSPRINIEQESVQRTSQLQNKYQDSKQKFVNLSMHDKVLPDQPHVFPEVQKLVSTLL
jgi:AAA15 family ATPase/GTPase